MNNNFLNNLKLPVIQAPMFLVSTPDLLIANAKAGIIGTLPSQNARSSEILDEWLTKIKKELSEFPNAMWGINVITHSSFLRNVGDIEVIIKHKVPLVISALGSPKILVEKVHSYNGLVFADVININFAKKAAKSGVDGLILITNGAGGHTGSLSPFAFVSEVKSFFTGIIVVGGAISKGEDILALQVLGADLAYIGTRFIATHESCASSNYKQMLVECDSSHIVTSNQITGVNANWLKPSLEKNNVLKKSIFTKILINLLKIKLIKVLFKKKLNFNSLDSDKVKKKWRDIYSSGQGVGAINKICSTGELIDELAKQYNDAVIKIKKIRSKE